MSVLQSWSLDICVYYNHMNLKGSLSA